MNYKNKANITLGVVTAGFIISIIIEHFCGVNFYTEFLTMIMEAAVVGGAADWFAITAIYRKPLGVAYHTEIVPKNREKIIEGISVFVERELLSVESLERRIEKINLKDKLFNFLSSNREVVYGNMLKFIDHEAHKIDKTAFYDSIKELRKKYIYEKDFTNAIRDILKNVYDSKSDDMFNAALDKIAALLKGEEAYNYIYNIIYNIKKEKTSGFLSKLGLAMMGKSEDDVIDIDMLTEIFIQKAVEKLKELKEKDNAYRNEAEFYIKSLINDIPKHKRGIEEFKNYLVSDENINKLIDKLFSSMVVNVQGEEKEVTFITKLLFDILSLSIDKGMQNENLLSKIDSIIKRNIVKIIESKHYVIGKIIRDTLNEFDNDKLNAFIDDKVGDDLQWIRINGSVVGAFVGAIVFIITYFVYDPILAPAIRGIFR